MAHNNNKKKVIYHCDITPLMRMMKVSKILHSFILGKFKAILPRCWRVWLGSSGCRGVRCGSKKSQWTVRASLRSKKGRLISIFIENLSRTYREFQSFLGLLGSPMDNTQGYFNFLLSGCKNWRGVFNTCPVPVPLLHTVYCIITHTHIEVYQQSWFELFCDIKVPILLPLTAV